TAGSPPSGVCAPGSASTWAALYPRCVQHGRDRTPANAVRTLRSWVDDLVREWLRAAAVADRRRTCGDTDREIHLGAERQRIAGARHRRSDHEAPVGLHHGIEKEVERRRDPRGRSPDAFERATEVVEAVGVVV